MQQQPLPLLEIPRKVTDPINGQGKSGKLQSLASRVEAMVNLLKPVLQNPSHTFAWRVGATQTTGFVGQAGGQSVFVFVAKEGAYAGQVISSGVVSASDWALWGLVP